MTPDGRPCVIAVPLGNRSVLVSVWQVRLGRVRLFLLDTDLEENAPWDRELSARLYGGDRDSVYRSIFYARNGSMPAWSGRLDDATLKMLAIYVHSLGGGR